ncbi:MAG: DEAD/DEAH box helicase [Rhodanobacter sp.]
MRTWIAGNGRLRLSGLGSAAPTADEVFRSVVEGEQVWPDVEVGRSGAASAIRFSRYPAMPRLKLGENHDGPVLSFEALSQEGELNALAIEDLLAGHFLTSDRWYPLESESAAEVLRLAKESGVPSGGTITSLRIILDLKRQRENDLINDRFPLDSGTASRLAPRIKGPPRGVNANLYPYQTTGWCWLRYVLQEQIGGLLADEMGLGKTLQVISVLADPGDANLRPALIIAPGSLLENWSREFTRFAPQLTVLKHHGPLRSGRPAVFQDHDVIVTSYETVLRDGAMMNMTEWGVVVLDEAQNIRNPDARRTIAVKTLRRRVSLAVTGTPVENRLLDLWSIFDFLRPGYLGTVTQFTHEFLETSEHAEQLEPLVSPLILRRLVRDVAKDLPKRIDIPQVLELPHDAAAAYDTLRQDIFIQYGRAASLVALTKLRMFCAHPSLVDPALMETVDFIKLQRLDELLIEIFASSEKVLIFTSYTAMADLIAQRIKDQFCCFSATLDSRLPIGDRQNFLDTFAAVPGAAALVLNPKAGGSGLNITAANHVVHYNPEWNPALEDQASARSYRRGQTLPVTVHRFFLSGTVEEVIEERLTRKRNISKNAIVGVEGADDDYQDIMIALDRSPIGSNT